MCEDTKQLLRDDVTRPMCFPTGEVRVVRQVVGRIECEGSEIVFFVRFADCFCRSFAGSCVPQRQPCCSAPSETLTYV